MTLKLNFVVVQFGSKTISRRDERVFIRSSLKHRNFKIAFEKIDFQNRFIRAKSAF